MRLRHISLYQCLTEGEDHAIFKIPLGICLQDIEFLTQMENGLCISTYIADFKNTQYIYNCTLYHKYNVVFTCYFTLSTFWIAVVVIA